MAQPLPLLIPAPVQPAPLRAPGVPLPVYRYVPGLWPHPFRQPGGHAYVDGKTPRPVPWQPQPWDRDLRWLHALDLFDQRYPWECHEALEQLWHAARGDPALALVIQGIIQAAAFTLKVHLGHDAAASRLLATSRARLLAAAAELGRTTRGIDLVATVSALDAHAIGGPWPLLGRPSAA